MKPILILKIKNLINYFFTTIILFLVKSGKRKKREKTLLLIRLDAIGDYILFRNFIEIIRNSPNYKNYQITLCGNIAWKSLAETFDGEIINSFIWINRKKFYGNLFYKYRILKKIFKGGFEIVVQATHSREILYGDTIVNAAQTLVSVGSSGSEEKHAVWKRKLFTDKLYTKLFTASSDYLFEFAVNKGFVENLLGYRVNIKKPELNVSVIKRSNKIKNKYILIFPGAGEQIRMWASSNFKEISEFILDNYSLDIALSGSKRESYLFYEIASSNFKQKYLNFFGNTLPELAKLISESELLISNDTSAIHFAAAINNPFICISNGNHFGRFHPYPKEIFDKAYYIYPPEIMNNLDNTELLKKKYRFSSVLNINEIKPQTVKEIIKKILK
jgi:ADP-heptose:LPS heptosyltransferase